MCQEYYETLEEAKKAVGKFIVKTGRQYSKLVKTEVDERLSPHPDKLYREWKNWYDFLEYSMLTYDEATFVMKWLGVQRIEVYKFYAKMSDIRLHSNPNQFYKGRGWKDVSEFLGIQRKKCKGSEFYNAKKPNHYKFKHLGSIE